MSERYICFCFIFILLGFSVVSSLNKRMLEVFIDGVPSESIGWLIEI